MTENKRFDLKSIHFQKFNVILYDNLVEKELHLSIFDLIGLLNEVASSEYTLKMLRDDINNKLDGVIQND